MNAKLAAGLNGLDALSVKELVKLKTKRMYWTAALNAMVKVWLSVLIVNKHLD
ncbi:hypothetical protein [Vibrio vulnificus]|uniref:hypothetical protein n=1 Tax=Vibrio vulnificus TaxID=672 RepID=UPI00307FB3B7